MAFGVVETPEYRALNPNGRIPTIEDDGYVLWESNTIVRYLAMKHGLGALCPSDLAARFDAERWMDWQLTTLDRPVRNVFWALVRTAPEKRDPAAVETAQAEAEQALAILDAHLAQRRFVGGRRLRWATSRWVRQSIGGWPWTSTERSAHVRRWYERLTERPGFREHVMQPLS